MEAYLLLLWHVATSTSRPRNPGSRPAGANKYPESFRNACQSVKVYRMETIELYINDNQPRTSRTFFFDNSKNL